MYLTGAGVPPGTYIESLVSGTGGNGTYQTTGTTVVTSRAMTAASSVETGYYVDSPVYTDASFTGTILDEVLTTSAVTGTIRVDTRLVGVGVPPNTKIVSQLTGTAGGAGTYQTSSTDMGPAIGPVAMVSTQGHFAQISTWG
jgi:hypothetical protein